MPDQQKEYTSLPVHGTEDLMGERSTEQSQEQSPLSLRKLSKCQSAMRINRPLVPLKVCLFFFFAAGAAVAPFLQVYIVQLGISVPQLSIMYMISPIVYFLGPALSGIIADKIGQAKPVFIANLMLAVISLNAMLLIPSLNKRDNPKQFDCPSFQVMADNCYLPENYPVRECQYCVHSDDTNETTYPLCGTGKCKLCGFKPTFLNVKSVSVFSGPTNDTCVYSAIALLPDNSSVPWCSEKSTQNYSLLCKSDRTEDEMDAYNKKFILVFSLSLVLLMAFSTVMSNCYRMLDVTAMHMVKDHDSDFGRVRFWSILSSTVIPPLAGLIVDKLSGDSGHKNYSYAFYLFNVMVFVTALAVWRLDVRISPPGEKMWKKTMLLLKKPEFCAFGLVLLFLGTSWGLAKSFSGVYLKSAGADSLLLGLVTATNSVGGLPFLLTSNWWVRKIGTTNILLLGFVGYTVYYFGYAYLQDPWYAIWYELTSIFTYHLLWVAVVRHSHDTAPQGLTATVIASAGGIHYGIGKGSGGLIAGYVRDSTDKSRVDPLAYLVAAGISSACFVLYGLFLCCRRREQGNAQEQAVEDNQRDETAFQEEEDDDEKIEKLSSV